MTSTPTDAPFHDRMLSLGLARVAEQAALASASLVGRGDEKAADQAAVNAMREQLNLLDIQGVVVIGEGERDEAPMLYIGEEVGTGKGPGVDIALDPLEGTTLTAKDMPNALTVIAMGPRGSMLHAPDTYMDKLAIGPGFEPGVVSLEMSPRERVEALAKAKGCAPADITVCILERPRHEAMIAEVRETGAAIRLITDGDVAGVMHCAESEVTGIDMYMGQGGAPEGVLAAAALKCMGGQIFGRLQSIQEAFIIAVPPVEPGGAPFSSLAEQVYLVSGILIGVFGGPAQAASRTLLARLAPASMMTEFFGLYSLSGKATSFIAPFAIAVATGIYESQRAGLAVIIGFLIVGLFGLLFVREERSAAL